MNVASSLPDFDSADKGCNLENSTFSPSYSKEIICFRLIRDVISEALRELVDGLILVSIVI